VFGQRGDFIYLSCFILLMPSSAAAWCQNRDTILLSNVISGVHWLLASLCLPAGLQLSAQLQLSRVLATMALGTQKSILGQQHRSDF
jgi:hypothetical protein